MFHVLVKKNEIILLRQLASFAFVGRKFILNSSELFIDTAEKCLCQRDFETD